MRLRAKTCKRDIERRPPAETPTGAYLEAPPNQPLCRLPTSCCPLESSKQRQLRWSIICLLPDSFLAGILLCVRYIRTGNYAKILARENETQGVWNPNEAKIAAQRKNEEKMKALGLR